MGNAAEIEPELARRGERFDAVTDQTSAHDALDGYVPAGLAIDDGRRPASRTIRTSMSAAPWQSMADHVRAMLALPGCGLRRLSTTATTSGPRRRRRASTNAFDFPGFVPAFIRPLFCEGKGPFRWAALSGDPGDIARTRRGRPDLFPDDASLHRWITMAQERVPHQGLPARICWLGYGERARAGLAFNELVRSGAV